MSVSEGKKSIGEGSKPGGGGEGGEEAANPTTKETEPSTAVAGTGEGGDAAAAGPPKESPGLGLLDGDDLNLDDEPTGPPPPPPISKEEAMKEYAKTKKDIANYKIRPDLDEKFRVGLVQVLIEKIVREYLEGQVFSAEETPKLMKMIVSDIHAKVKSQKYKRYKIITYVAIGERRGEGVSSATRCIWDAESDCLATYTFLNETMFCCATVYGIYYY